MIGRGGWCVVWLFVWPMSMAGAQPLSQDARISYKYVRKQLKRPVGKKRLTSLYWGFEIMALSQAARGLASIARRVPARRAQITGLLGRAVRHALHPRLNPYRGALSRRKRLGFHGLYLSHLNAILGEHARITRSTRHRRLHTRLPRHLARHSLKARHKHFPSYPKHRARWPADQVVTLYSLWRYDQRYKTTYSRKPIKAWLRYIKRHRLSKSGLHWSSVTPWKRWKQPRGCALSYSLLYLPTFAPKEAKRLYRAYKGSHLVDLGFIAGFREWPPGFKGPSDADSGPIIMGVGAAASAFGIGAALAMGDMALYRKLLRLRRLGYFLLHGNKKKLRRHKYHNLLTHAIILHTDTR